jgi:hypothetical protein
VTLTRWQWLVVGPLALVGLGIISLAVASALSGRFSHTSDGGGWGISDDLAIQHGVHLVDLSDEAKREVFSLIERALPRTKNLGQQDRQTRAASTGPDFVDALWIPDGSRETLMPPNPRDDRIWSVLVSLETTLRGTGPALRGSHSSVAPRAPAGIRRSISATQSRLLARARTTAPTSTSSLPRSRAPCSVRSPSPQNDDMTYAHGE